MTDVDTTREQQLHRLIIENRNQDGKIGLADQLNMADEIMELIDQARAQAFDDLLEAMAKKRPILENVSDSINDYSLGHNAAITKVTDIVHQLKSSKKGGD